MAGNIRPWLARLVRVVAASISPQEAAAWVQDVEPLVATRFNASAFTFDSLESVAAQCKYLPTYAELVDALGAWQKANPPPARAIAHDPFAVGDFATKQREESWRMTPEQVRAKVQALDGHWMRIPLGHALAAALEQHAPHLRPLLPPEFLAEQPRQPAEVVPIETAAERFRTTHGRLPGQLTAEQLKAMRNAEKPPAA